MSTKLRAPINENYYARHNTPTFGQIAVQGYHFTDEAGRQYQLAMQSRQVFANSRVQFKPKTGPRAKEASQKRRCVTNQWGYIKLYVKLAHGTTWFGARDINHTLQLQSTRYGTLECRIKSTERMDPHRATGVIYVKGLDTPLCNSLINR